MKLTDEQKGYLIALRNSPGYNVLLLIENEAKGKLSELLFKSDFSNPAHLKVLEKNQTYMQAREDLLKNIDKHTREIYTPESV